MGCCSSTSAATDYSNDNFVDTTPVRQRKCRDVPFLILFILALGGAGYLSFEAFKTGDPGRYMYGSDSWGNVCGRKNNRNISGVPQSGRNFEDHTFEFYTALSDIKMALDPMQYVNMESGPAVLCVKQCPNVTAILCKDLLTENGYDLDEDIINNRVCQMPGGLILKHTSVLNRCVPSVFVDLGNAVSSASAQIVAPEITSDMVAQANGTSSQDLDTIKQMQAGPGMAVVLHKMLSSVANYWQEMVYLILISLFVSLISLLLLQLFTRVLVVTIIIVAGTGSIATTAYLWYVFGVSLGLVNHGEIVSSATNFSHAASSDYVDEMQEFINGRLNPSLAMQGRMAVQVRSLNVTDTLGEMDVISMSQMQNLLPMAILSTVITIVVLVLLVWVRKSLCLVISLFDEASMAVFSMPGMLLQPIFTVIALTVATTWFLIGAAFIYSSQRPVIDSDGMVRWAEMLTFPSTYMIWPHLFVFFWIVQFVMACQEIILAGAISRWFFTKGAKRAKCHWNMCSTLKPTGELLLFNLGSAALGSLIIALVWLLRTVLAYLQTRLRKSKNKLAEKILKCMQCILACFEKLLKYINRNAYIAIAMYGDGFCGGAKHALSLLVSNAQHMAAVNCVGGFCLILGKLAVTVCIGFIGLTWFTMLGVRQEQYITPLAIACVCSFFVASCFFAVFGIALDTIFLCFCDDQQRNNGHDRPYFSSAFLQKYMTSGVIDNSAKSRKGSKANPNPKSADVPQTSAGVQMYPILPVIKSEYARNKPRQKRVKTQLFHPVSRRNPRVANMIEMVSIKEVDDNETGSKKPAMTTPHQRHKIIYPSLRMFNETEADKSNN